MCDVLQSLSNFWQSIDFWKLVTILVAAFAAWVAHQQYLLGRERFRLDLFEKRFAVFAATRRLLTNVLLAANVSLEQLFEYRGSVAEASFLFESDITDYLDAIDQKALKLHTLLSKPTQERARMAEDISDTTAWLNNQLLELKDRFSRYMKFRTWT